MIPNRSQSQELNNVLFVVVVFGMDATTLDACLRPIFTVTLEWNTKKLVTFIFTKLVFKMPKRSVLKNTKMVWKIPKMTFNLLQNGPQASYFNTFLADFTFVWPLIGVIHDVDLKLLPTGGNKVAGLARHILELLFPLYLKKMNGCRSVSWTSQKMMSRKK